MCLNLNDEELFFFFYSGRKVEVHYVFSLTERNVVDAVKET